MLDEVAEEADRRDRVSGTRADGDQLHLPYWAELWDSALGIGRHLVRRPVVLSASGVGGGEQRRHNATLLDLGCGMGFAGTVAAAVGWRVTFADLEPPALLFARLNSLPWAGRVDAVRRLNWQTDRLGRRFDLIVGADILYERKQWDFLEPFWRAHLAPGGSVLLGEPGRQTGDLFGDWILARGWRLIRHEEPVPTRPRPIRLFELKC